ncbi:phosphatase PAP2 family protein [Tessaracoccus antarcticus]|uniref:Phosphatase PAP2 family protein n=1 Tax=Tessaracoccus antarcticus TaxID=2479848 RepID=A0A3M0FYG8_9ACTN|nr:phosphatase PAP2 family protein [Tessaracoccus antarcticus]RMB57505.1 phosphatase PAP2 family protein [Tessaracoccus antarcticus]
MAKDGDELSDKAKQVVDGAIEVVDERVPVEVRPHVAILVPALVGAFILGLLTWAASEIYEAVTERDGLSLLDQPVLDYMVGIRQPWLNTVVGAFTQIGGPVGSPIIALIIVVWLCLRWRSWLPATLMVAAALGSLSVTIVGKNYIDRVRPPHQFAIAPYETSPSFPSGHALNAVVVGGVVAYLLWRRFEGRRRARVVTVVLAVLYALSMGLSRVYLGHHWLTDVITGWILGVAWLATVVATHIVAVAVMNRRRDRDAALPSPEHPSEVTDG